MRRRSHARRWRAAAFLALALALCSAFTAAQQQRGEEEPVVALLELEAPARSPFVLRATLPIPKGVFPRRDGLVPLGLRSHGPGAPVVPAQMEIVSRYPSGEADVVELVARVELARGERPGERIRYEVVPWQHEEVEPPPRVEAVERLLDPERGGRVELRARDAFGNVYRFDLIAGSSAPGFGAERRTKRGAFVDQWRVAGTLVPAERPARPKLVLPHLMGVHAYFTVRAEDEVVSLDLRVHNGAIGTSWAVKGAPADPLEAPLGLIYWKSLELVVPEGYVVVPDVRDPSFGAPREANGALVYPLVAPLANGKLHMMPPQAQFQRRLAIAPRASEALAQRVVEQDGLAFCVAGRGLWSWFAPSTARFFPQRDLLAAMDFYRRDDASGIELLRAHESARLRDLRSQLETGEPRGYPSETPAMGWAHPWFLPEEGPPGGEDIDWYEGYRAAAAASREGYRRLELLHRMNASRQAVATYDRFGEPVDATRWLDADGRMTVDYRVYGRGFLLPFKLPCRGGPPASEHVRHVVESGLRPPYDRSNAWSPQGEYPVANDDLLSWMPHDGAHLVRWTKNSKALVWLGNDALAKDDLRLDAELYQLHFHGAEGGAGSAEHPMSLRQMELYSAKHPHAGLPMHREHGWGIDAVCAYYSLADEAWRERARGWLERVADVLVASATPSGLVTRAPLPELHNDDYHGAQTFHCEILMLGQRDLLESVFRGVDRKRTAAIEELFLRSCEYLYWGPPFLREKTDWSPADQPVYRQGPAWSIPIARADGKTPPLSDAEHWGPNYWPPDVRKYDVEAIYCFPILAFASDFTQRTKGRGVENRYLRRALDMDRPVRSFAESFAMLSYNAADASLDTTRTSIGYLARLQVLGVHRK